MHARGACDDQLVLTRLSMQNLRCFSRSDLALRAPAGAGTGWTILVGENGVGKSTILQAIVLAALDPRPVTNLVPDAWTLVRSIEGEPLEARIVLTTAAGEEASRTISGQANAYVEGDTSELGLPLLLAFSARRRISHPGELPKSENLELERVRGLFETDHPLLTQDPFLAFDDGDTSREFAQVVRDVIVHKLTDDPEGRFFPLINDLELKGRGGVTKSKQLLQQRRFILRYGDAYSVKVGIEDLSDGYQAMFAVVLEILYQAALASHAVPDPATLEAVILIDEIEAHLHPRWQRTVVPLFREVFPRCQFIATTHSPLVVGSAAAGEVVVLEVGDDGAVRSEILDERLGMLGASRIYDEVFGVPRSADPKLVEAERLALDAITRPNARKGEARNDDAVEAAWQVARSRVRT